MADSTDTSARMQQFQSEVDSLGVSGGRANPERTMLRLGVAAWVVGVILIVVAYIGSHGTTNDLSQRDFIIIGLGGVVAAVIGTGLFVTYSLMRYLRYWLIRLIYTDRESTDRMIEALKR